MDRQASDIPVLPASNMSLADAEGVSDTQQPAPLRWYVALVKHNTEKACAAKVLDLLRQPGPAAQYVETYVPTQKETRVWRNGRKKDVERVLCPCYLFIRCSESVRRSLKTHAPFINSFIKNRAMPVNDYGQTPFAHIPDDQMYTFMQMVTCAESPVTVDPTTLKMGDKVRVNGGPLKGLEGYLLDDPAGTPSLAIRIDILGSARVEIPANLLESLKI